MRGARFFGGHANLAEVNFHSKTVAKFLGGTCTRKANVIGHATPSQLGRGACVALRTRPLINRPGHRQRNDDLIFISETDAAEQVFFFLMVRVQVYREWAPSIVDWPITCAADAGRRPQLAPRIDPLERAPRRRAKSPRVRATFRPPETTPTPAVSSRGPLETRPPPGTTSRQRIRAARSRD